jgi:hypothetical protein
MFVDKVEDGRKTQTIRATRKIPIKTGDTLHLFTGQRTGNCRRLTPLEGVECIYVGRIFMLKRSPWSHLFQLDGRDLSTSDMIQLSTQDGFPSLPDFLTFFLPKDQDDFLGQLIRWNYWAEPVDARDPKLWKPVEEATR